MSEKTPTDNPPPREKRLFALRGAVQCLNEAGDITEQVAGLYDQMLRDNRLAPEDIVSLVFSVTPDLDALNPASALRRSGRAADLALFAVQEAPSQGGLERTIRALLHCYLDEAHSPRHIYRNGAEVLRPDRASPGGSRKTAGKNICHEVESNRRFAVEEVRGKKGWRVKTSSTLSTLRLKNFPNLMVSRNLKVNDAAC
jgi:chorismate mutase